MLSPVLESQVSSLERQAAGGVKVSVPWERRVSVGTNRLWQVQLLSDSLILDRCEA